MLGGVSFYWEIIDFFRTFFEDIVKDFLKFVFPLFSCGSITGPEFFELKLGGVDIFCFETVFYLILKLELIAPLL